jgi:hypothetical protein
MLLLIRWSEKNDRLTKARQVLALAMDQVTARFGLRLTPLNLILITLGTDPMTGRLVAKAAGHGFLTGWALTIIGDMMFFFIVMVSMLWLSHVLGNGTWAAVIITIVIVGAPTLVKKYFTQ